MNANLSLSPFPFPLHELQPSLFQLHTVKQQSHYIVMFFDSGRITLQVILCLFQCQNRSPHFAAFPLLTFIIFHVLFKCWTYDVISACLLLIQLMFRWTLL